MGVAIFQNNFIYKNAVDLVYGSRFTDPFLDSNFRELKPCVIYDQGTERKKP